MALVVLLTTTVHLTIDMRTIVAGNMVDFLFLSEC